MPGQSEAGTFILSKGFSPQSHLLLLLTRLLPGVSQLRELPAIMGPNWKPVFQHPPCSRAAGERPQRAGKEPQNCESRDCCIHADWGKTSAASSWLLLGDGFLTQVDTGAKGIGSDCTAWSWAGSSANPVHLHFSLPLLEPRLSCLALYFALQGLGPAWEAVALPVARSSCHKAGCFGLSARDLQARGVSPAIPAFCPRVLLCGGSGQLCQRSFSMCWRALSGEAGR